MNISPYIPLTIFGIAFTLFVTLLAGSAIIVARNRRKYRDSISRRRE